MKKSAVEKKKKELIPRRNQRRCKKKWWRDPIHRRNVSRVARRAGSAGLRDTNVEQIDKSEDADVQRDRIVAFSLVGRRLVRRRRSSPKRRPSVVDCQPRVTYSPPKGGECARTAEGLYEFCHWLRANVTHRAQERPAQFTRISFVQSGSIIDNARLYLPPLRASLREEAGCAIIL